jgi:hypothetical protein
MGSVGIDWMQGLTVEEWLEIAQSSSLTSRRIGDGEASEEAREGAKQGKVSVSWRWLGPV